MATTTAITTNFTFIGLFCIVIYFTLIATVQSNTRANFISQTGITSFILLIITTAIALTYIPHDWLTTHPYISIALLTLPVLIITIYAAATKPSMYMSPYYELPHKILLMVCFISFVILLWLNNPVNMFTTKYSTIATVFMFLMGVFAVLAGIIAFSVPASSPTSALFFGSLYALAGFVISALFIGWLTWLITKHTQKTGWLSIFFLVSLMFVLYSLVAALFKTMAAASPSTAAKSSAFTKLINATILYLPCLFNGWWKSTGLSAPSISMSAIGSNITTTTPEIWALLALSGALLTGYYYLPSINQKAYLGNCHQLLRDPISLHGATTISTYEQLGGMNNISDSSGNTTFDYKYGISLWYYLDAHGANMSSAYNTYTPLFNYGNKPAIEYNGRTNSLRIKMGGAKELGRTVYEARGTVPLQKWTNIVVNYNGGTVDVFIDGTLIKSVNGVAPYMSLDNVVVGAQDGVYGRCCNVIYCPHPFTASQIYYLQYLVKDYNPPVFTGQFI